MDHYDDQPVEVMRSEYEAFKGFVQETMAERQMAQVAAVTAQQEAAFRQQAQDYDQAIEHFSRSVTDQIKLAYNLTDEQAKYGATNYMRNMVQELVARGGNPAEVAYNLAKTYGYKPAESKPSEIKEYDDHQKAVFGDTDPDLKAEMDALWSNANGSDEDAQLDRIWAEMEKEHYSRRF